MESIKFLMRSAFVTVMLVLVADFINVKASDQILLYVSPGIKIGWDSNRGFTMGPKIGIGIIGLDDDIFINLTIGAKSFQNSTRKDDRYIFIDIQVGSASVDEASVAFGAGFGLLFGKGGGDLKITPRMTAFVGLIVFPTLDFNFWTEDEISSEPGFELTLPIPMKKIDFGLE